MHFLHQSPLTPLTQGTAYSPGELPAMSYELVQHTLALSSRKARQLSAGPSRALLPSPQASQLAQGAFLPITHNL